MLPLARESRLAISRLSLRVIDSGSFVGPWHAYIRSSAFGAISITARLRPMHRETLRPGAASKSRLPSAAHPDWRLGAIAKTRASPQGEEGSTVL